MISRIVYVLSAALLLISSITVFAGTLILKSGGKVSDVEIEGYEDGELIISKDNVKKRVPVSKVKAFYKTELGGDEEADIVETADYDVKVYVEVPEKAYDRKGKKQFVEIEYRIVRKGENKNLKKVKAPYFYMTLLTTGNEAYGNRKRYFLYYPDKARVRDATDRGEILKVMSKMDRPIIYFDRGIKRTSKMKLTSDRTIKLELSSVKKDQSIIGYHLEVWGNDDEPIFEQDWKEPGISIAKKWWKINND